MTDLGLYVLVLCSMAVGYLMGVIAARRAIIAQLRIQRERVMQTLMQYDAARRSAVKQNVQPDTRGIHETKNP